MIGMIEKCGFGWMVIGGREYRSDLMILPDGVVVPHWRRGKGHLLTIEDIAPLVAAGPGLVIAGTGIFGRMKPAPGLAQRLAGQGIELVLAWTKPAVGQFNVARDGIQQVGGCFHLTC